MEFVNGMKLQLLQDLRDTSNALSSGHDVSEESFRKTVGLIGRMVCEISTNMLNEYEIIQKVDERIAELYKVKKGDRGIKGDKGECGDDADITIPRILKIIAIKSPWAIAIIYGIWQFAQYIPLILQHIWPVALLAL